MKCKEQNQTKRLVLRKIVENMKPTLSFTLWNGLGATRSWLHVLWSWVLPLLPFTSRLWLNTSAVLSISLTHHPFTWVCVSQTAHALVAKTELPTPACPDWILNLQSGVAHITCPEFVHLSLREPMCLDPSHLSACFSLALHSIFASPSSTNPITCPHHAEGAF